MKTEYILNIGLESNPLTFDEVVSYLNNLTEWNKGVEFFKFREVISTYNGKKEITIVAYFNTKYRSISTIIEIIEKLCITFNQECIAMSNNQMDILIYSIKYNGEKQKFNSKYFVR